jgi:tetratricopeptide (TPR) repeat protein
MIAKIRPITTNTVNCDSAVDHTAAARAAFAAGDYAESLPVLFCALAADPRNIDLQLLHVEALIRCGLVSTVYKAMACILTLAPERQHDLIKAAQTALITNPADEGAAMLLVFASIPTDNIDALVDQLLKINPSSAYAYLMRASNAIFGKFDPATVSADLEKALALAGDDAEIIANVATFYVEGEGLKDAQRALELHNRALELNPDFPEALLGRGVAYSRMLGNIAAAQADYDRAIQLDPYDYRVRNFRGILLNEQGDYAGAFNDFKAALGVNPQSPFGLKGATEAAVKTGTLADRQLPHVLFTAKQQIIPVPTPLTAAAPLQVPLLLNQIAQIDLSLTAGQALTLTVEPRDLQGSYPLMMLIDSSGGAVAVGMEADWQASRAISMSVTPPIDGDYQLLVKYSGMAESEMLTIRWT